ncbi:SHOCT domain-containing protein [Niveibacterium microcysteis]|uniref:SHOCT domain-containing protein n=1 Tax=Niveibacterium microcysteis TaxID=2811415 RepID=A0ABX7MAP9_9RHOO|nr:SHOCT domain-containing protein [Niveibacterium microcysteis]QSI78788.1 SHOCT domain-containing protein [Niveibacterium microcysteis]
MQHKRMKSRFLATLALAMTATLVTPTVQAGWFDQSLFGPSDEKRLNEWAKSPEKKMTWGEWDFIRLATRGDGSKPNAHPVQLNVKQVAAALASIQGMPFKDVKSLFSDSEVERLSQAVVAGLKNATPDQELVFVSTGQHAWTGLVAPVVGNCGRIFFADGKLNVLLGMHHADFVADKQNGSRLDPKFDFGSRTLPAKNVNLTGVTEGQATLVRNDWIALTLQPDNTPAAASATPSTAPAATAAPIGDSFYTKQESRLKALQRLRDQGLITEAEFQAKRAQIIKDL